MRTGQGELANRRLTAGNTDYLHRNPHSVCEACLLFLVLDTSERQFCFNAYGLFIAVGTDRVGRQNLLPEVFVGALPDPLGYETS